MINEQVMIDTVARMLEAGIDEPTILSTLVDTGLTQEDAINIVQKEDDEIEKMLEDKNYPKFASETNENKFSYDYLLNMRIRTLTKSKMEELNKTRENKLGVYNDLLNKEEKDLWKDDLNKFLEIYKVNLEKYNKIMNDQINKDNKEVKKIKKTKKTTTKE